MDFDRDIVALRCPLGGFSHFEASTGQINTELALKEHIKIRVMAEQLFNQEGRAQSHLQKRVCSYNCRRSTHYHVVRTCSGVLESLEVMPTSRVHSLQVQVQFIAAVIFISTVHQSTTLYYY